MFNETSMSELLEGKNPVWLPLLSGSMAPSLLPGDKLYIEPEIDKFKSGDIVVFFARGKFFSHRVLLSIKLNKTKYLLEMGDANHQASFISTSKALGRVTKLRRGELILILTSRVEEKTAKKTAKKSLWHLIKKSSVDFIKSRIKK